MTDHPSLPVLNDLSEVELALIDAARHGTLLTCSDLGAELLDADDDPAHQVRAELLRGLLLGQYGPVDPRGVRVKAAQVTGCLDLNRMPSTVGLELNSCAVTEPITAVHGHLPWLSLHGSKISTLRADGLCIDGQLQLRESHVTGSAGTAIRLLGARVGGTLDLGNVSIANEQSAY